MVFVVWCQKFFLFVAYLITVVSYGCFGLYGIIAGDCETDPLFSCLKRQHFGSNSGSCLVCLHLVTFPLFGTKGFQNLE